MKALVVCDDAEVIAQLDTALQQYGIDTILYRWLLKALDNIEEISPDFTIISASDYPRHWKTLSQFINSGIGRAANKIILYTPDELSQEERKKADALGIRGCFSSLGENGEGQGTLHSLLGAKETQKQEEVPASSLTEAECDASPKASEKMLIAASIQAGDEETDRLQTPTESPTDTDTKHHVEDTVASTENQKDECTEDVADTASPDNAPIEDAIPTREQAEAENDAEYSEEKAVSASAEDSFSAPPTEIEQSAMDTVLEREKLLGDDGDTQENESPAIKKETAATSPLDAALFTETEQKSSADDNVYTTHSDNAESENKILADNLQNDTRASEPCAAAKENLSVPAQNTVSSCVEAASSEISEAPEENTGLTSESLNVVMEQSVSDSPLNNNSPETDEITQNISQEENAALVSSDVHSPADTIFPNKTHEDSARASEGEEFAFESQAISTIAQHDKQVDSVENIAVQADLSATKRLPKKRTVAKSTALAVPGTLLPHTNYLLPDAIERFFQKLKQEAAEAELKASVAHSISECTEKTAAKAPLVDHKIPSVKSIAKESVGDITPSSLKIPHVDTLLREAAANELCDRKKEASPLPDYKIPSAASILTDMLSANATHQDCVIPNVSSILSNKNNLTALSSNADIHIPSVASILNATEMADRKNDTEESQPRKSLLHKIEEMCEK